MSKLTRVTAKVFGATADGTLADPEIGQFGSAKAGTYVGTGDVATIQNLSAWSNGWIDAVTPTQQFPSLPERTGVDKVLSYQNAYVLQQGIPEWDSATDYYTNGFCSKNGKIYFSKTDNNVNNDPETDTVNWEEFTSGGGSRNIGEIVQSTIPLTDAGLHLLDGSLINGSGIYSDFVDYIADLYNSLLPTARTVYNVNIVGSLTNTNGVLSGFSTSNYATLPNTFNPSTYSWEKFYKFTTGNDVTTQQLIECFSSSSVLGASIVLQSGGLIVYLSSTGNTWNIASNVSLSGTINANTTYYLRVTFDGSKYEYKISTDNETFTTIGTITNSATIYPYDIRLGINESQANPFLGSIDLNSSYININGQRWWNGTTQIVDCFTAEGSWQASVSQYGSCGKFVYDSVNNTVRLPKVTGFIEGASDVANLGDLTQAGLPDHTHTYNPAYWGVGTYYSTSGPGQVDYNQSTTGLASASNPIYGRSNTVQPQSIKVLYYIVIATSTKTDIQVDIDEIATDLNGKADVDLTNCTKPHIVETYKNGASWYRKWSDGFCEQGGFVTGNGAYGVITVNLLVPFIDTNYIIYGTQIAWDNSSWYTSTYNTAGSGVSDVAGPAQNKTTTTFQVQSCSNRFWLACGYIN